MPDTGSAFYPAQPLEGRSFKPCPRYQSPLENHSSMPDTGSAFIRRSRSKVVVSNPAPAAKPPKIKKPALGGLFCASAYN